MTEWKCDIVAIFERMRTQENRALYAVLSRFSSTQIEVKQEIEKGHHTKLDNGAVYCMTTIATPATTKSVQNELSKDL